MTISYDLSREARRKEGMSKVIASICIPAFNHERFIADAVRSALSQEYDDYEVIVSDDASVDRTAEIAGSFLDKRLKLVRQRERLGIVRNWNACINASRGRYFCLLSSDDILEPTFLAEQVAVLEEHRNAGLAASGCWIINSDGDIVAAEVRKGVEKGSINITHGRMALKRYTTGPKAILASVVFRKELVDRFQGFNEEMVICGDWEMYVRLLGVSDEAYNANILARLRLHSHNTSVNQEYIVRTLEEHRHIVTAALNTLREFSPPWEVEELSSKAHRDLVHRCLFTAARYPQFRKELLDMAFGEDGGVRAKLYTFFIKAGLSPALVAWEGARHRLRHAVKSLLWRMDKRSTGEVR